MPLDEVGMKLAKDGSFCTVGLGAGIDELAYKRREKTSWMPGRADDEDDEFDENDCIESDIGGRSVDEYFGDDLGNNTTACKSSKRNRE